MKTPQRVDRPSFRQFADYFSDDQIIRVLCRMRVGEARRLNERLFLQRIKPDEKMNERSAAAEALEGLFPPRRAWRKYRPRNRERLSGSDSNFAALHLTIRALRNGEPPPHWAARLNALIRAVQDKALRESPVLLSPPEVMLALKDGKKPSVRRPICSFPMVERVVISLTARYLREHLDHSFDRCSLAFRCRRGRRAAPKHHDAVQQILKYRKACGGKKLYVAECDIQGFFDAVDHQLARQSLDEVAKRASRSKRISGIAQRSLQLFDAYLDCFTFPRNILRIALPEAQKTRPGWSVKWPEEALREFHDLPRMAAVGVPQGGALSALISNTLLDRADRALFPYTMLFV